MRRRHRRRDHRDHAVGVDDVRSSRMHDGRDRARRTSRLAVRPARQREGHIFTRTASATRGSLRTRSGDQSATCAPGIPWLPPGGVTPPGPAKYGTLAWRYVNSPRNVTNWLGMKSNVSCVSHATNGSPGFSVKYGVPDAAVAPLIAGSRSRKRPGLSLAPPPSVTA